MLFPTKFLVMVVVFGLAIIFWRYRPWPHGPKPRWLRLTILAIAALYLAFLGTKVNPGGPFVSVMHDIIPCGVAVFVLVAAVRCLRDTGYYGQILALVPMFPAVLAINGVARNVLEFWTRYAARGPMIGL